MGRVENIWIKRFKRGPMDQVDWALLVDNKGIASNADASTKRQVTIISQEAWARVCAELGVDLDPKIRRANLLVSGLDLEKSRGKELRIGACLLRIEGETRPCRQMDEAYAGLQRALAPEWRGGAFAVVVEGGELRLGDSAEWVGQKEEAAPT